jgi:hypothetical protein
VLSLPLGDTTSTKLLSQLEGMDKSLKTWIDTLHGHLPGIYVVLGRLLQN